MSYWVTFRVMGRLDGDLDLILSGGSKFIKFLLNDGNGNFENTQIISSDSLAEGIFNIEILDVNKDNCFHVLRM